MGAPRIKKDYRQAVARVKHFNAMTRTGGAYVTVAFNANEVIGYFVNHEAAARWCEKQGVTFTELKSEMVKT